MIKTWPKAIFERHAGWFVLGGWLLLLLVVGGALTVGVAAMVSASYHPLHRSAPFNATAVNILWVSLFAGIVVALLSSIALAMRWRFIAGLSVAVVWFIVAIGAIGALAITKRGPELFERYVGERRFLVPWQYAPLGQADPNGSGFSIELCLETLRGTYDSLCRRSQKATVRPRSYGFRGNFDEGYWRENIDQMERLGQQHGHEAYAFTRTTTRGDRATFYYTNRDEKGRLVRLVRCYGHRTCRHHTLVGDYALTYDVDEAALERWKDTDQELVKLVESWRKPSP